MEIPKFILKEGTTVDFTTDFLDKGYFTDGVIKAVHKDECMHKHTLRDLCYTIECSDSNIYKVHHSNVFETILCPDCNEDLLQSGVDEKVWRSITFNRHNKVLNENIASLSDDAYQCGNCGVSIGTDEYLKLRKYLNI